VVTSLGNQINAGTPNPVISQVGSTLGTVGQTVGQAGTLVNGATGGTGSGVLSGGVADATQTGDTQRVGLLGGLRGLLRK
ncbi:MAG TPA: hypothetical protein DIU04_14085, partial [Pseudomonas sp.]|nr:hypothetical protein [Pseudomonas sp.]